MKLKLKLFAFVILAICSTSLYGQDKKEMKLVLNKISYEGLEISIKEAREMAKDKSPKAYEQFRLAQKMQVWNIVWSAVGGYELGAGFVQVVLNDNPIGYLDMGLGGVLVALPHFKGRKTRQLMYVKQGIEEYNKSL